MKRDIPRGGGGERALVVLESTHILTTQPLPRHNSLAPLSLFGVPRSPEKYRCVFAALGGSF